jgi:HPt (histidine-containing phosphotransfer) domain-containing protein
MRMAYVHEPVFQTTTFSGSISGRAGRRYASARDCAGDDLEELRRLVGSYLREMDAQLDKVEELIAGEGFSELARCAHRSGGASATFGMSAIAVPLRSIESLGLQQTVKGAEIQLAEARRQLGLIREFLKTQPEKAL